MTFTSKLKTDDETARLAAVKRYQILDTVPEVEFDDIIQLVKDVLGAPIVAISLIDSDRQWFKAISGVDATETPREIAFCDYTIRSPEPLMVNDTTRDHRFAENPLVTQPPGLRCYLGVPLQSPDGYNVGSLCVMGQEARSFTDKDVDVLRSFAKLVVSQMELRLVSRKDALTGTLSRAGLEQCLASAFECPERDSVLLMVDIDLFKRINDTFGHQAGDASLRHVARVMQDGLRKGDQIGRYGGEEFAILLHNVSEQEACALANRIRENVAAGAVPEIAPERVTISIGLAPLHESVASVGDWIKCADKALYQAKLNGRNQVVLHSDTVVALHGDRRTSVR